MKAAHLQRRPIWWAILGVGVLLAVVAGFGIPAMMASGSRRSAFSALPSRSAPAGSPSAPAGSPSAAPSPTASAPAPHRFPLLGAYYYSWYPENLAGGTLGSHLVPPAGPDASYASFSPAIAQNAITQATTAGIDFFALDWWPNKPELNRRIDTGFLAAPNLASTHFALFYETQALGPPVAYSPNTPMTPAARTQLVADMVGMARSYFANPHYLRIGGRPVLFWYLTRTMTGDVAGAVAAVRAALARLGYNVFLVGDEMFWRVTTEAGDQTTAPQVDRARLFDAITWYNLYDASTPSFAGYGSTSSFLSSAAGLVNTYRTALGGSVPIVPSVIPGYNDRATRPAEAHPAIPQQWSPGAATGSFLKHMYQDLALPDVDPRAPMVMVSTWNEFNEQTAIAPVPATPTTTVDDSPSHQLYTQGYQYGGTGQAALDTLAGLAAARPPPPPGSVDFPSGG